MLGSDVVDGAVGGVLQLFGRRCKREGFFGSERDIPETVGGVAFADDDDFAVFVDLDVVLGE